MGGREGGKGQWIAYLSFDIESVHAHTHTHAHFPCPKERGPETEQQSEPWPSGSSLDEVHLSLLPPFLLWTLPLWGLCSLCVTDSLLSSSRHLVRAVTSSLSLFRPLRHPLFLFPPSSSALRLSIHLSALHLCNSPVRLSLSPLRAIIDGGVIVSISLALKPSSRSALLYHLRNAGNGLDSKTLFFLCICVWVCVLYVPICVQICEIAKTRFTHWLCLFKQSQCVWLVFRLFLKIQNNLDIQTWTILSFWIRDNNSLELHVPSHV